MNITTASDSLVADPIGYLINELDLSALDRRLRSKYPTLDVDVLVLEYRRFLVLKWVHRDEHAKLLSPSPMVDQVWHEHILETASYIPMCLAIGLWIHHDPDGAGANDAANRARRRENTVDLYTARFGPMDDDVWDMEGFRRPYPPWATSSAAQARLIRLHSEIEEEDSSDNADDGRAAKKRRMAKLLTITLRTLVSCGDRTSLMEVSVSTQIRAIFHASLEEHGLAIGCWRFMWNGQHIGHVERSVGELGIQDGDVLDVVKSVDGC